MKQIASVITGLAAARPNSTGEPPSETGCAVLLPATEEQASASCAWMGPVATTMRPSAKRWLATAQNRMSWDLIDLGSDSLTTAIESLTDELDRLDAYYAPAPKDQIIKTLAGMASLFGAPTVEDIVIDLYVATLTRLPRQVFLVARDRLVMSHKYPNLPKPADFVEAGAEEQRRIDAVYRVISARLVTYRRALDRLHERISTAPTQE